MIVGVGLSGAAARLRRQKVSTRVSYAARLTLSVLKNIK